MDNYIGKDVLYIFENDSFSFRSSQIHLSNLKMIGSSKGVEIVSPESFVYSFVNDNPVIIRGVTRNAFVISDYFELVDGQLIEENDYNTALLGEDIAKKLGLKVNDTFVIPSSRVSTFTPFKVKGIFKTYSLMDSEILVPLESVWNLDLNPKRDYFSVARIRVNSSLFDKSSLAELKPESNSYDVSSSLVNVDVVQKKVGSSSEKNMSLIGRLNVFLGHRPSTKDYVQEAVEEVGQAVDRNDYVDEEIDKIKENLNESNKPVDDKVNLSETPTLVNNSVTQTPSVPEQKNLSVNPKNPITVNQTDATKTPSVPEQNNPPTTLQKPAQANESISNIEKNDSFVGSSNEDSAKTDMKSSDIPSSPDNKLTQSVSVKDKSDVYSMLATEGFKDVVYVFAVIIVIVLITSIFAIFSSVANMIFESRSELSIISYVGAKKSQLSFMFIFRLMVTTFAASVLGVILGFGVILFMSRLSLIGIGSSVIQPFVSIQLVLGTILFTMLISFVSAIIYFKKSEF
jgi:ABC-type lipoprotein release transport system permease subunit